MGERAPRSSAPGGYGRITRKGYREVWDKDQHRWRKEHIVVWERAHGPIPPGFDIHHGPGGKLDNSLGNLSLLPHRAHRWLQTAGRKRTLAQQFKRCKACGRTLPLWAYYRNGPTYMARCKPCHCLYASKHRGRRGKAS